MRTHLRRRLLLLLIAIGFVVFIGGYLLLYGDPYSRVRVESIQIDENGWVTLVTKSQHSSGSKVITIISVDGADEIVGSASGSSFPPWPVPGGATFHFSLDPEGESNLDLSDRSTEAIKVIIGQTYTVTPDKPLILYAFNTTSGHVYEGRVEVSSTGTWWGGLGPLTAR